MDNIIFYRPSAIVIPDDHTSFPIFQFTEELRQLAPQITWKIIGKPLVMLDCHVAQCYGKCTGDFNKQIERNKEYFKPEWRFQPTQEEWKTLKHIVNTRFSKVMAKCHNLLPTSSLLLRVFGTASTHPCLPWFYTKKGVDMAAFFQSTPIARMRAMYIVEVFNELERATFDPTTDPQVQAYLKKMLAEQAKAIAITVGNHTRPNTLDCVQILTDLGFTPSLPNHMATKKDIATFLQMPESSLTTFLARHRDQIQAIKLTKQQIQALGKKANHLNAYTQDDVFKIAFWMDTEIGKKLKQQIFGDLGVYSTPGIKEEVEWKIILSKMFAGLGFQYQYHIGDYIVDFWVEKLALVLECDRDNHRYYNKTEETRRDKYLTQHYSLIRFNSHISIELLVNAILKIQPKQLVKLYLPLEANKDTDK